MELIGWVALLFLGIWVLSLNGRVRTLERKLEKKPTTSASEQENPFLGESSSLQKPLQSSQEALFQPGSSTKFVEWMKEDWLLKLGAFLVLIGFGWFVSYAFLKGWIGPMGRIVLGIISGILILLLGDWRIKKYINQGSIFLVLGSTIILLTIFAAREVYDFFTPLTALIVMFLSSAFIALESVRYKSQALALCGLVFSGVAPLLTNSPDQNYIALFAYLTVVVLGAIWVVGLTGWRNLTPASLLLISFYSFPHFFNFTNKTDTTLLLYAFLFTSIFFITNTIGILKLKNEKLKNITPDLITAAGNGMFLLFWILTAAQEEWKSLIISAWMVVFTVGAFLIFSISKRKEPFYVYAGVGVVMLATATGLELSGPALTIAYIIETAIVVLASYIILRDINLTKTVSFLFAGPLALSAESFTSLAWRTSVFHDDFSVLALMGIVFFGLGLFFLREKMERKVSGAEKLILVFLTIGAVYFFSLLWLSLHAGLQSKDFATMIALFVYTIVGIAVYIYGQTHNYKVLRVYGGLLLGFVVGRLLLVEVWSMELTERIIIFFLIGALLMSTAFLGRKKRIANKIS